MSKGEEVRPHVEESVDLGTNRRLWSGDMCVI